jgi:hypothetical protein
MLASAVQAEPLKLSDKESRQVMADFARCVVTERPQVASQSVVEDWDAKQIIGAGSKLMPPTCVRAAGLISALRFQASNARAALAEQLILRDTEVALTAERAAPVAPLAYHQPWPVETVDKKGRPLGAKDIERQITAISEKRAAIAGQQFGECVVRANPPAVRSVFATKVGDGAELEAIKALSAVLPACVPAGKRLSIDRNSLRGILALSYYRMAMAARGVGWAGAPIRAQGAAK